MMNDDRAMTKGQFSLLAFIGVQLGAIAIAVLAITHHWPL